MGYKELYVSSLLMWLNYPLYSGSKNPKVKLALIPLSNDFKK